MSGYKRLPPQRIDGITIEDWRNFAAAIISKGPEVVNADYMESVLRSVQWDSRIKEPNKFQLKHLRLAMSLIQMGRVDQIERSTP